MQKSDVVFWETPERLSVRKNQKWMERAAQAAVAHRRKLKVILGVKDADILQVNVFALYTLGTVKKCVLKSIAQCLPSLPGLTMIFYPVTPKRLHRNTIEDNGAIEASASAAVGASDPFQAAGGVSDSDSDVDAEVHDFDGEGALPEALTSLHSVKSAAQRNAQLAADCHDVDKIIEFSNSEEHYPRRLHFLHQKDGVGECATTAAMVLLPTNEEGGVNMASLSESVMLRSGTYTEVPVSTQFVGVSQKLALQARRAMAEGGSFTNIVQSERCQRFAASKVSRSQLGSGLHETWIRDQQGFCGSYRFRCKALYMGA